MITGINNTTLASTNRTVISYDSFKRWTRIQEYQGTNTTPYQDRRFVWNGTTLAEERDATGTNIVKRFFADGFQWKGTNFYYLKDHLGSIREVADTNGNIVARFDYDPYGRRTQTFGTLSVDFGFAGLFEHQSGNKLAVWRIYDPNTAKWLSIDPIRENGGWNLYAYCGNDPVNATDVTGQRPVDVYIWFWQGVGVGYGRVGHVMITEAGTTKVILSQFPEHSAPKGPNKLLSYDQTLKREGTAPDVIYRVQVEDDQAFDKTAHDHATRPIWIADPIFKSETHCTRAAYDSLQAGGLSVGWWHNSGQILPGTLADILAGLARSQPKIVHTIPIPTQ